MANDKVENLSKIIKWSLENKELWEELCYFGDSNTPIEKLQALIEECKHNGFMELYYLLLSKTGEIMDKKSFSPYYIEFIKKTIDKNTELDLEEINNSTK